MPPALEPQRGRGGIEGDHLAQPRRQVERDARRLWVGFVDHVPRVEAEEPINYLIKLIPGKVVAAANRREPPRMA